MKDFNIAEDDAKLSFLNQPLTNGSSVKEEVLEDTFEKKLTTLLSQQDVNQVFNLVENKFGSGQSWQRDLKEINLSTKQVRNIKTIYSTCN